MMQAVRVQSVEALQLCVMRVDADRFPEVQIDVVRRAGWRCGRGDVPGDIDQDRAKGDRAAGSLANVDARKQKRREHKALRRRTTTRLAEPPGLATHTVIGTLRPTERRRANTWIGEKHANRLRHGWS